MNLELQDLDLIKQHKFMNDIIENNDCIRKLDNTLIKHFIKNLIDEIYNQKPEIIANNFIFPQQLFEFKFNSKKEFINQWNQDNRLKNYFDIGIYDEKEILKSKSTLENTTITYTKISDKCFNVQFALGDGFIFSIIKIVDEIKIKSLYIAD